MPLTLPQLVIAALAVVLVIGLVLVARRKRGAKAAQPKPVADEAEAAAAPTRRRQLQSFVDTEWDTPPEPLPEAHPEPEPQFPIGETFAEPAAAEVAPPEPFEIEPATYPTEAAAVPAPDYDQAVLARLEEAFEALQAGELSLEAYRERILAEQARVDRHIALLEAEGDSPELQAALVAQESVRWCLDWAEDQDRPDAE